MILLFNITYSIAVLVIFGAALYLTWNYIKEMVKDYTMTKRKKATRAYKIGFTDGCNGEYKNPYPEGSQWAFDYERGYDDGTPQLTCYQCDKAVEWLAPDSRCGDCTRMTVEEVSGC